MKKIVFIFAFLFLAVPVFAQTVILKSGKEIKGKISKETDEYIEVDFHDVTLTFFRDEIASIQLAESKDIPEQNIAQPPAEGGMSLSKQEILEKIRQAKAGIRRVQIKTTEAQSVANMISAKNKRFMDTDLKNKILHSGAEVIDIELQMQSTLEQIAKSKIDGLIAGGATEEEIAQAKQKSEQIMASAGMMMNTIANQMKGFKTESYIVNNTSHMGINGKWFKFSSIPFPEGFWGVQESLLTGSSNENTINEVINNMPAEFSGFLSTFSEDPETATSISEGSFLNQPCYIVEYDRGGKVKTMLEEIIKSMAMMQGVAFNPAQLKIEAYSETEFISQKTFLAIGSKLVAQAGLQDANSDTYHRVVVSQEALHSYPLTDLEVPEVVLQAEAAEGEDALKNALLGGIFKNSNSLFKQ